MTETELKAALQYLAAGDVAGTNDAHTIAGVAPLTESGVFTSGTTDNVQVAIQGTGASNSGFKLWYRFNWYHNVSISRLY